MRVAGARRLHALAGCVSFLAFAYGAQRRAPPQGPPGSERKGAQSSRATSSSWFASPASSRRTSPGRAQLTGCGRPPSGPSRPMSDSQPRRGEARRYTRKRGSGALAAKGRFQCRAPRSAKAAGRPRSARRLRPRGARRGRACANARCADVEPARTERRPRAHGAFFGTPGDRRRARRGSLRKAGLGAVLHRPVLSDRWLTTPGRPTSGPRWKRVTRATRRAAGDRRSARRARRSGCSREAAAELFPNNTKHARPGGRGGRLRRWARKRSPALPAL